MIRAFVWLAAIRIGLWTLPFPTLRRILRRLARGRERGEASEQVPASRVAWAVRAASRCVPQANCLPQALTLQVMLTRMGETAHLQIGAARSEDGQFEAHAWVECQGSIVLGGSDACSRYTKLPNLEWELL